jgi:PH/SEC7 domain-containing protein
MSKFGLGGTYGRSMGKSAMSNPMDKIHINDWTPPIPALVPGTMDEEAQLEALQTYNKQLRADMDAHKALEEPMMRQFTPGSRNASKARENWTARAGYIHTEIVKYETYIDSLRTAIKERLKQAGERKLEKSLMKSNASLSLNGSGSGSGSGKEAGTGRGAE